MADFKDIVTEIETIANAQNGINSFKYGNPIEINESRQKTKPMLMLHKQRRATYNEFEKPIKTYECTIGIYDTYLQSQRATKDYSVKQQDLENLMEHFLREFRKRSHGLTAQVTSVQDWFMLERVTTELIEVLGSDSLVGIEATITIQVASDCDTGTFSY
jgi:hypothetical protein|tara:strand:+ start:2754 stop:3233 length:480 start_codon:yes stop_codon:yes gene_type:complete